MSVETDRRIWAAVGFSLLAAGSFYEVMIDLGEGNALSLLSDAAIMIGFVLVAIGARRLPRRSNLFVTGAAVVFAGYLVALYQDASDGMGVGLVTSLFSVTGTFLFFVGSLGLRHPKESHTELNIMRIGLATAIVEPILWLATAGPGPDDLPANVANFAGYALALRFLILSAPAIRHVPIEAGPHAPSGGKAGVEGAQPVDVAAAASGSADPSDAPARTADGAGSTLP
ncbi:MAG: hypothetical protein ACYDDF_02565 [Thermoplasmatota archaeon]